MTLREHLIRVATAYAEAKGLSAMQASRRVFKDGKTLPRLLAGGDVVTETFEAAMTWFAHHWPADLAWPADIPFPAASPSPPLASGAGCGPAPEAPIAEAST